MEPVRVYTLGTFQVVVLGQPLASGVWRRSAARRLFKYLLTRPHRRAHKEEAIELLWPEGNPASGGGNLRAVLTNLRQALAPAAILESDQDSIWLRGQSEVWVDADAFEETLSRARSAEAAAELELLQEAQALYQGEYLPDDLYEEWVEKRAVALRRRWRQLQFRLGRLRAERGEVDRAIEAFEQLLRTDGCDEDAAEELIGLLAARGRRAEALHTFDRVAASLRDELGVEPRPGLIDLREGLLTSKPSAPPSPREDVARTLLAAAASTSEVASLIAHLSGQVLVRSAEEAELHIGVFSSVADALRAVDGIHHGQVRGVRMALHISEDDFESAMAAATQLALAAHPGQTLLSAQAAMRVLAHGQLATHVTLKDLGEHRIRAGQPAERVYQLNSGDFPALLNARTRAAHIPMPATTLVGREREVAAVKNLLRAARLATLTGPGGVGKTRLALQLASELHDDFPDGVFFVPVDAIVDAELVATAIAQAVGVRESVGRSIAENLVEYLRHKDVLLVIDNFEQVLSAAPLLADLIAECPRLHILVTSRAVLHLKGEHTHEVPPLETPDERSRMSPERLREIAAVRLFAERAIAARSDFSLTVSSTEAVAEICRRLDGLPLAIELAAARVRLLSSGEMARLDRFLPLLTGGSRDAPVRHQALQNTIEWSVDLLTPQARLVFERLAVCVGGCTRAAAEEVCGLEASVTESLAELIDMSLVRRFDASDDQPTRYRMLQTIREYALNRLEQSGDSDAVHRRFTAFFLKLAERAERDLARSHQAESLSLLEAEHENLRAALQWTSSGSTAQLETGLRLAGSIWRYWLIRGHVSEGRAWLDDALSRRAEVPLAVRAKASNAAGELACAVGDLTAAIEWCARSLEIYRELDDRSGTAQALHILAWSVASHAQTDTEYAQAASYQNECLDLERQLGEPLGEARALHELGEIARYRRDYNSAATLLNQARQLRIALDDAEGVGWSSHCLAWLAYEQADYPTALRWSDEALRIWHDIDHAYGIGATLSLRARVLLNAGLCDEALNEVRQALDLWPPLQHVEWLIYDLEVLAWIMAKCRLDGADAATLLGAAERQHSRVPLPQHRKAELQLIWQTVRTVGDSAEIAVARERGLRMDAEEAYRYATSLFAPAESRLQANSMV